MQANQVFYLIARPAPIQPAGATGGQMQMDIIGMAGDIESAHMAAKQAKAGTYVILCQVCVFSNVPLPPPLEFPQTALAGLDPKLFS